MWNFSERTVQIRGLLIFVSIVLILSGLGFILFTSLSGSKKATDTNTAQTPTQLSPQTVDISPFVPVDTIGQLIKPCYFAFYKACTEPVSSLYGTDSNPTADPTQNTSDETKAANDVSATINISPNKGLSAYQVPIEEDLVSELFPEYSKEASSSAVLVPAPYVVSRVAIKFGVNQRVLLVLMSLVNKGAGPLFSYTNDFSIPYSLKDPGFARQLVIVASDLQATRTKYDSILHDSKAFPTSVTFFDKKYAVEKDTNVESLALADFLSRTIADKKDFERAIYIPESPDTSGTAINQNFILTYELLYKVRPR